MNYIKSFFFYVEEYLLEDAKKYRFLSCGGLAVPGVDDAHEFQNTVSAMQIMGLSPEDLSGLYNLVDGGVGVLNSILLSIM